MKQTPAHHIDPFLQKLDIIFEVAASIASQSSLEKTLKKICRAIVELFDVEHSGLVLFDDKDKEFVEVAAEYPSLGFEGKRLRIDNVPFEIELVENLRPVILDNIADKNAPLGEAGKLWRKVGIETSLIVPIVLHGKILASFSLDAVGRHYAFSEEEIRLCHVFAAQVAVAINTHRLMEERVKQLASIRQTALALTTITDADEILHTILKEAVDLLQGEQGVIKVYDEHKKQLIVVADYGHNQALLGQRIDEKKGMAGQLLQSKKRYLIVDDYPGWEHALTFAANHLGAVLGVSLRWQGRFWGALYVDDKLGRQFNKKDAELLSLFADHVVVALQNANLIEALNRQNERYEQSLAHAPYGVIANDINGRITVFNERAEQMLQWSQAEMLGTQVHHVYATLDEVREVNALLETMPNGRFRSHSTRLKARDGNIIPVNLSVTRVAQSQQGGIEYVGYFEDLQALRERDQRTSLLLSASNLLTRATHLNDGLNSIAELMVHSLNASFCRIFLLDSKGKILTLQAAHKTPMLTWQVTLGETTAVSRWTKLDRTLKKHAKLLLQLSNPQGQPTLIRWSEMLKLEEDLQTLLVVPLRTRDGKAIGLLDLGQVRDSTFSEHQIKLAIAIAQQTAVLIDRFQLFERTKRASERLRTSFEASNALISSGDPRFVLEEMVHTVCQVAKASGARLIRIPSSINPIELVTMESDKIDVSQAVRSDGLTMTVWRTQKPEVVNDVNLEKEGRVNPSFFTRNIIAAAGLPVTVRGVSVGVIWIYYDQPHYFTDDELATLQLYVNQAAIAFDSSERFKILEQMRRAAEALASAATLKDVLQQIVTHAKIVLEADSAVIWSYDDQRQEFIANDSDQYGLPHETWRQLLEASPEAKGSSGTLMAQDWRGWSNLVEHKEKPYFSPTAHRILTKAEIRSVQSIALTVGKEKLGILFANYKHPRAFSPDERRTALTFGTHAALSLSKTRLLESVRHVNETAGLVANMASLAKLDETLDVIANNMQRTLRSDVVTLHIYEEDKKRLYEPAKRLGLQFETITRPSNRPKSQTVQKILADQERRLVVDDVTAHPLFNQSWFTEREQIHSTMAICLQMRQENVGVLMVSHRTPHRFTSEELNYIELFANQAAVAIHNAQLYQRERRQAVGLLRLDNATTAIANSEKLLKEIYFEIAKQALHLTGTYGKTAHFGHLVTIDENKIVFEACHPRETYPELVEKVGILHLDQTIERFGIIGRAVKEARPIYVKNVHRDPDYIAYHFNTTSELAVPIIHNKKVIGAINVEHPDFDAFDEHDIHTLTALAEYAAIAINNVRLYGRELKQAAALNALHSAGKAVTRSLKREEILQSLVEQAWRLVSYPGRQINYASIWTAVEPLTSPTKLHLDVTWPPEEIAHTKEALGSSVIDLSHDGTQSIGIVGHVFKSGRPLLADDVLKRAEYLLSHETTRSELAVPMIWKTQIVGVINVESRKNNAFDKDDERALQALAAQAVNALENARLYNQAERRAKLLRTMAEITSQTVNILDEQTLLDATVELISNRLGFYHTAVFLTEPQGDTVVLKACSTARARHYVTNGYKIIIGKQGIVGHVAKTGRPYLSPDVSKDRKYLSELILSATITEMAFPLTIRGRVIGVLDIQHNQPLPTMLEEMETLQTMANQFANAIQNARLFKQTNQRAALLEAQYEAGQAITQSLDVQEVLDNIVAQGWELIGPPGSKAHYCSIATVNGNKLHFETVYPPERLSLLQKTLGAINLQIDKQIGTTGRAVLTGKHQLVGDVSRDPDYLPVLEDVQSNLIMPIIIAGKVQGVVGSEHADLNAFSEDDVETLRALAGHASIALQNARKFEATQIVQKVAAKLTGLLDVPQIIAKVMRATLKLSETESAAILFFEKDMSYFSECYLLESPEGEPRKYCPVAKPDGAIMRKMLKTGRTQIALDAKLKLGSYPVVANREIFSLVLVPLSSEGNTIGVLILHGDEGQHFPDYLVTALETLAGQTAVAVTKARQYEQLKKTKGLVGSRSALAWMGMASNQWRHRIEGDATNIRGAVTLLQMDLEDETTLPVSLKDELDSKLRMIDRLAKQILKRPITPPLSSEEGAEAIVINDLLKERIEQLWQGEKYQPVEGPFLYLRESIGLQIWASPDWVRLALDLLIDNAVEAMSGLERRCLQIQTVIFEERIEIHLRDTGPGFTLEAQENLFRAEMASAKEGHMGRGLLMVQAITQTYEGDVELRATGPQGSTMVVWFPIWQETQ